MMTWEIAYQWCWTEEWKVVVEVGVEEYPQQSAKSYFVRRSTIAALQHRD